MVLFLLISLITPWPSLAMDNCDKAARLACSPGELDDGTGKTKKASSADKNLADYMRGERENIKKKFSKYIEENLNTPKAAENILFALSATNAGLHPDCQDKKKMQEVQNLSKQCIELTAHGLAEKVVADLSMTDEDQINTPDSFNTIADLSDDYMLRQTNFFKDILYSSTEDLNKKLKLEKQEEKLTEFFDKIQNSVLSFTKKATPKKYHKDLQRKINGVGFGGFDCGNLSSEFMPNAFYDNSTRQVSYCRANLRNGVSLFQAAFLFAHEIAHRFAPCSIQIGPSLGGKFKYDSNSKTPLEEQFPFKGIINCLRDPRSVGAIKIKRSEDQQGQEAVHHHPTQHHSSKSLPFCAQDQINEAFPDWVASQVIAKQLSKDWRGLSAEQSAYGIANAFRMFCESGKQMDNHQGELHPGTQERIQKIILRHPTVRKKLRCRPLKKNELYCDKSYKKPTIPQLLPEEAETAENGEANHNEH